MPKPSYSDYYPFGSSLPTRSWSDASRAYRYGFNGKEKDSEGMGGGSSTYDYGFRIYNSNLGRFLSVDPLLKEYPWYTTYQFAGNKPIWALDLDGLEEYFVQIFTLKNSRGKTFQYKAIYRFIDINYRDRDLADNTIICPSNVNFTTTLFADYYFQFNPQGTSNASYKTTKAIVSTFKKFCNYTGNRLLQILRQKNNNYGSLNLFISPILYLGNDEGYTKEDLKELSMKNGTFDAILDVAAILINDPNSKVTVIGSASRKATNMNGSKSTTTEENNLELANKRANAGKELLIDILKNEYKKSDTEITEIMKRVSTESKVEGNSDDSEEVASKNRSTEFKVN